ncbi:unnamed protein product [Discosporangium mesarthrocarpum]
MDVGPSGNDGPGGGPGRGLPPRGESFTSFTMPYPPGDGGGRGGSVGEEANLPPGVSDPAELNVHYILAKGYLSEHLGMLGFPAYNVQQLLLGFYREIPRPTGQTQVVFMPAHRIHGLKEKDTSAPSDILRKEMKKGSQSVISLPNCNNSLEKMREDAFMYYWSKSMMFDMAPAEPDQQGAV